MNIINIKTFEIKYNFTGNLSHFSRLEWAVIDESVQLFTTEIIDEEEVQTPIYNSKYIDSLTFSIYPYDFSDTLKYNVITAINNKSTEEIQAYLDSIAEQNRVASFQGKKIKMTIDYGFALENLNSFVLKCQTDSNITVLPIKKTEIKNEAGAITQLTRTATILMNTVFKDDFDALTNKNNDPDSINLIETGILIVDTIGGEPLDFIENDIYKYLVPQLIT